MIEFTPQGRHRSRWIAGKPERSLWGWGSEISTSDKPYLNIRTYRCVQCGYLESYAKDDDTGEL